MKTVRSTIAVAISRWVEKADPKKPCRLIKLVHEVEGRPNPQKIEGWSTPAGINLGLLATEIEDTARNDAQQASKEGIVEIYGIIPYFGDEMAEGAYIRFRIASAISDDSDGEGGSQVGMYSEGATPRGQTHQGMRHNEAMARIWVDGVSRIMQTLESENRRLSEGHERMASRLAANAQELEEARDRSVERQLAVFRIYEEEKRNTKLIEGLFAAAPGLLNMALGRPILPENTQDQGIQTIKNWAKSLTIPQMEALQSTLEPQQYMPLMMIKQQVEEEAEREEKASQERAQQEIQNSMKKPEVIDTMARRDAAGIPREPLGGA